MSNDCELAESGNATDNKLKHLYDGLWKTLVYLTMTVMYTSTPSLFVINESLFRDEKFAELEEYC